MVRERVRDVLAEGARYTRASLGTLEATVRSLGPVRGRKVVVLLTRGLLPGSRDGVRDRLRRETDRGRRDARERRHLLDRRRRALGALTGRRRHGKKPGPVHQARPAVEAGHGREPARGHARRGRGDGRARRDQPQRHRQGAAAGPRRQRPLLPARVPADVVWPARPLPPHRGPPAAVARGSSPGRGEATSRSQPTGGAEGLARPGGRGGRPSRAGPRRPDVDRSAERRARADSPPTSSTCPRPAPWSWSNVGIDVADVRRRYSRVGRRAPASRSSGWRRTQDGEAVEQFTARVPLDGLARAGRHRRPWHPHRPALAAAAPRPLPGPRRRRLHRDPTRRGSASQWIEVPDLSTRRLALSSLFLSPRGRAGGRDRRRGTSPASAPLAPVSAPGAEIDVVLYVYNARDGRRRRYRPGAAVPAPAGRPARARVPAPPDGPRPRGARPRAFPGARGFRSRACLPASTSCGPSSRTATPRRRPSAAWRSRSSSLSRPFTRPPATAVTFGRSGTSIQPSR